jgi:hypothetical protein
MKAYPVSENLAERFLNNLAIPLMVEEKKPSRSQLNERNARKTACEITLLVTGSNTDLSTDPSPRDDKTSIIHAHDRMIDACAFRIKPGREANQMSHGSSSAKHVITLSTDRCLGEVTSDGKEWKAGSSLQ